MKTIKTIIIGALYVLAFVSGTVLFLCMCASDTNDLGGFVLTALLSALTLWACISAIKYLNERWYKK